MTVTFFDTETTGLVNQKIEATDPRQPDLVQMGIKLDDNSRNERAAMNMLVTPYYEGEMHPKAEEATGLTKAIAEEFGADVVGVYDIVADLFKRGDLLVAHNIQFDMRLMRRVAKVHSEILGSDYIDPFQGKNIFCTMHACTDIVKAPHKNPQYSRGKSYKWPTLQECHIKFFGEGFDGAHDALADVRATARVFYYLQDNHPEALS